VYHLPDHYDQHFILALELAFHPVSRVEPTRRIRELARYGAKGARRERPAKKNVYTIAT
jgi:hypothetical protein